MSKNITFNTGRPYSAEGQVITLSLNNDCRVLFHDHTRMIGGEILTSFPSSAEEETGGDTALVQFVMDHYDEGNYKDSSAARQIESEPGTYTMDAFA